MEVEELFYSEFCDLEDGHERMKRLLVKFQERFAKGSIYIPFNYQARNAEIVNRYNGKNERHLAREYGLSLRQISKITQVKKQQMQRSLF
jgi:Mor family transcriptional regulator